MVRSPGVGNSIRRLEFRERLVPRGFQRCAGLDLSLCRWVSSTLRTLESRERLVPRGFQ